MSEEGDDGVLQVRVRARASGSQTVLVVALIVAGAIGTASLFASGPAVYVGLAISLAIAGFALFQWKHSAHGADDPDGTRFNTPLATLEAGERGLLVQGPADLIATPENVAVLAKLAHRFINKKPLPAPHGYLEARGRSFEAVVYTAEERALESESARAEAERLNEEMREALTASRDKALPGPTTPVALPPAADQAANAVQPEELGIPVLDESAGRSGGA